MKIPERHISKGSDAFSSYWIKGGFLKSFLSDKVDLQKADFLIPLYSKVDELGDELAKEYLLKYGFSEGIGEFHRMIASYPNSKEPVSEFAQKFLEQFLQKPHWVDDSLLLKGTEFTNRTGTFGLSVLRNYCLMGGYESSAINKPLIFTGALKQGAAKRLTYTVDFWVNVTQKNGLNLSEKGFFSVLSTRMIHSFSRISIEKQPEWNSGLWGRPLNTADMLATNLGFSVAFLDGLHKLGFRPAQDEIKGVLHLWKYIGYLIGIPLELLPDTMEKATEMLYLWSVTQKGTDSDSIALAESLYLEPLTVSFTDSQRIKNFVKSSCLAFNHVLLGQKSCEKLNLPKSNLIYWIYFQKYLNRTNEYVAQNNKRYYHFCVNKGRREHQKVRDLYLNE